MAPTATPPAPTPPAAAAAAAAKKEPKELPIKLLVLVCIGFPVSLLFLVVGLFGMAVLLDEKKTSPLSQSVFGVLYWGAVRRNPYVSAMTVNGGGLGTIVCGATLFEHFRAVKIRKAAEAAEAAKAEKKAAKAARKESKKAQ